jgi:hypothetical protein
METFPAFADKHPYKGQEVLILKKAQLLAADLYRRFEVHQNSSSKISRQRAILK